MLNPTLAGRIWLCTQPTDMRCSFDGLSARVRRHLGEDPTSGHWFVFINRRRSLLKILAFDTGGYWIWSKRLEQGQFGPHGAAKEGKRILSVNGYVRPRIFGEQDLVRMGGPASAVAVSTQEIFFEDRR